MAQDLSCCNCKTIKKELIFVQDWTHDGYYCDACFEKVNKGLL